MALEKDTAACPLLRQRLGQIRVSVRAAVGLLDEVVEGSSSPGHRACLWRGRSSPSEAGGDVGQVITFESPLCQGWKEGEQQHKAPCVRHSSAQ